VSRCSRFARRLLYFLPFLLLVGVTEAEVDKTVHNLAVRVNKNSGDGEPVKSCIFCHTPHNANPTRALWNRALPANSYKLYESPTLEAVLDQPTGSSRLCLSCHDGTIALEDLRVKPVGAKLALGYLAGKKSLGTDLSDDHPISFTYNSVLAQRKGELADPAVLPPNIAVDRSGQLQCTSCHDPHEDRNPKFLVADNKFSQLCVSCHRIQDWSSSIHATSPARWNGSGPPPWPENDWKTVAENGCGNCHRVHSAGRPQWLLGFGDEEKNCLDCHDGSGSAKNVARDFKKISSHPIERTAWVHRPKEEPRVMEPHVTCSDCHNPHTVQGSDNTSASLPGALYGAQGINASGAKSTRVNFEYEVCFACHGVNERARAAVIRKDPTTNALMEFSPANRSYHPVVAPGRNPNVRGLESDYTASSRILCSDCHSSDDTTSKGPHGSRYEPILERQYDQRDPLPESSQAYALCYKCHNQTSLLKDGSGFPHQTHVVKYFASCAVCHDAHGSRSSTHLINFMITGTGGAPVVTPSSSGRLEFFDLGDSAGECYLTCHGTDHDPKRYPAPPP
jgi:predicted CXXCH cytochrome family protein